ncbi:FGFR1 oncogene partner 2 homolog isoform X2 [Ptychodera flava]|uniref:FGFR1 oncogene partner 2 homolog isoform X2 n=1 Tax=Ptychodera flava TaxID=63121 RepID=UPI003969DF77
MTLTIEQVMADAKKLVDRLAEHDGAADALIAQSQTLNKRIDAMKQYQEDLVEMNEAARHRPRSALVLGIQQENRQIRELQQENKELRTALEEHQSALELIMSKYREQVLKLILANKLDKSSLNVHQNNSKELQRMTEKICEMAVVMADAIDIDDEAVAKETELITRLQIENKGLREVLGISHHFNKQKHKQTPTGCDRHGTAEQHKSDIPQQNASNTDQGEKDSTAGVNDTPKEVQRSGVSGKPEEIPASTEISDQGGDKPRDDTATEEEVSDLTNVSQEEIDVEINDEKKDEEKDNREEKNDDDDDLGDNEERSTL